MICFYHRNDLDGKTSAAIVHRVEPKCKLIPIDYGDEFPWNLVKSEDAEKEWVYMVDFTLQPFKDMIRLNNSVNLIWIDHHETAIREYEKCLKEKQTAEIKGIRKIGIGACELVWNHFYEDLQLPIAVKYLADYDVFKLDDPKTLLFQYGMRAREMNPDSELWPRLFKADDLGPIIAEGKVVLNYQKKLDERCCGACGFEIEFEGHPAVVLNGALLNSLSFESLFDPEKHKVMIDFYYDGKQWNVGLYSPSPDGVNVGEIAKKHGGGGHAHAAGFQNDEYPLPK